MARIHGSRGQVKMDPTGGATVATVADLNTWSLELTRDRVDVTAFGDTNKQSVSGLPAYSGELGGFWNSATSPVFFDAALADVAVMLHLIPDTAAPTYLFKGLAHLDASIEVSATGAVSFSGSFAAAGPWVMEP